MENPDPKLDIENSPFYLNTAPRPWFSTKGEPRRSGVSAFGFGGSNFHVVLEEYQPPKLKSPGTARSNCWLFRASRTPVFPTNWPRSSSGSMKPRTTPGWPVWRAGTGKHSTWTIRSV
ncbi:ketoacyl-synthetase C-terminal extension domain-containing protein [Desulfosarcina cetonica]|uniref:ketoacyl-synthetase C-terminal extension domain-containing protein n=1 Tax=Desulfosarcina cetonica TaxID=90730 RepID=UPI0012EE3E9B|nr:ketoacyl-synthetase C-terminal extension domain-containing protein [Desulfosarcina cetonica]